MSDLDINLNTRNQKLAFVFIPMSVGVLMFLLVPGWESIGVLGLFTLVPLGIVILADSSREVVANESRVEQDQQEDDDKKYADSYQSN